MKRTATGVISLMMIISISCINKTKQMENELRGFITHHDSIVQPITIEANLAYWSAAVNGNDSDYMKFEELSKELNLIFANKEEYQKLKSIKESGEVKDTLLTRQLDVLYDTYLANQTDTAKLNKITSLETLIEKKFSTFRADVNGKSYSDNEIENVLSKSTDSKELEAAWKAHKKIGVTVSGDILALVKLRNEVAHKLGFKNFHEMSLKLGEQDPAEIEKLFDELDTLTRSTFASLKDDIDTYLANRCKIDKSQLMPWHYQNRYFQEAPKIYKVDIDVYYKDKNLETLTRDYYKSLGLSIDDLMAKSDLYERPKKNQHAFCTDINNEGDVRVLCNLKSNQYWMNTMLHEFGHATYDKYIDASLPLTIRQPAHIFTTEAIAMMFGRLSTNPQWLKDVIGISETERAKIADDCYKTLRLDQMIFSRWVQVMYRFEKSLYENPDQDLNSLWWTLVEKYQLVKKPEGRNEPDWASKIHIATAPCYYHNYLMGELLASQLNHYIAINIYKKSDVHNLSYYNNQEVGKFLQSKVFAPGMKYKWNDMIERATGEKLTAKYYAMQFVK
jgi:peptidyl-dipeptidase A